MSDLGVLLKCEENGLGVEPYKNNGLEQWLAQNISTEDKLTMRVKAIMTTAI